MSVKSAPQWISSEARVTAHGLGPLILAAQIRSRAASDHVPGVDTNCGALAHGLVHGGSQVLSVCASVKPAAIALLDIKPARKRIVRDPANW